MRLGELVSRLLNPRANLSGLRHAAPSPPAQGRAREGKYFLIRHVLFNVPLMLGGLIVLLLFIGVLFGALLAPQNPYLHGRQSVEYVDGVISAPPFPPSPQHPMGTDELGRDTMSMLLYGTRNTLVAAAFITMARLILGLVLGGLAGWNEGQQIDQIVMGSIQMMISLPMLLVAMILIFALDIRRGLPVFIVALCSIGWGEIAQYVRGEFIRLKNQPFIDSGRAIGLNSLELAIRHVLPNVLPALIVITLLEMGAVLMILGELGFIGVYIGGGTAIPVGDFSQRQYYSLPEWGAMMAGSRQWARSYPWMVIFPAISFFASVTGFNLLGEGLRRLIDRGIFNTAFLLTWRMAVAITVVTAASIYVILTLGPAPSYRHLAQQVSEADLMRHIEFLSAPDMNGRAVGSPDAYRAAEYIANELDGYGLDAPPGGWLKELTITMARPAEPPELSLVNEDGTALTTFTRLADYGESIEHHGGSGEAQAPVTAIIFPPQNLDQPSPEEDPETAQRAYARFRGLDLRERIVMIIAGNAPSDFDTEALIRGAMGVLLVTDDVTPRNQVLSSDYLEQPALPIFRITPPTADAILAGDGLDVESLRQEIERLDRTGPAWVAREIGAQVRMHLRLETPEEVVQHNIMWLIDGSDANLSRELVIVACHYDGLGRAPDGMLYPGANSNASGVAALLEIARLWQEQEFQPRRSVLFAAWSGGELPYSGAHYFHDIPTGYIHRYNIVAVINMDRMGSNTGDSMVVDQVSGEETTLLDLLVSSADELDVDVVQGESLHHRYQQVFDGRYGTLITTWGDPPPVWDDDTADNIDPHHLSQAAQVVNLTLITAAHEPRY